MWRFMLVSFGFLGFAFYEMSGGADYAPAPDSLQVAGADTPLFAVPEPVFEDDLRIAIVDELPPPIKVIKASRNAAPEEETVARADTTLASLTGDQLGRVTVTLAGTSQGFDFGQQGVDLGLSGVGAFSADTLVRDVSAVPLDQALPPQPADIRSIARASANMRSGPGTDYEKVDQLTLGAPVEVLDSASGWVRLRDLETGQTGWMADWLVTASN